MFWVGPRLAFNDRIATLCDLQGYHAAITELFGRAPLVSPSPGV
jgi:hypothetical protein